jgi:hypothetical protein
MGSLPGPWRVFALAVALLVTCAGRAGAQNQDVEVKVSLPDLTNQFWFDVPISGDYSSVTLAGSSANEPDRAGAALRLSKEAVTWATAKKAAIEGMAITVKIGKEVLKASSRNFSPPKMPMKSP